LGRLTDSIAVIAPPPVQMMAKMRSASSRAATAAFAPEIAIPDPIPVSRRPTIIVGYATLRAETTRPVAASSAPTMAIRRCDTCGTYGITSDVVTASVISSIVPRSPACWWFRPDSINALTITGAALEPR
jgi:hypothetical protein